MSRHHHIDDLPVPADDPAMRRIAAALFVAASMSGMGLPVQAAPPDSATPREATPHSVTPPPAPTRRQTLDDLFARLAAAKDEVEARGIAGLIERRFSRSGSDTADLLMERAGEALNGKDAALAVELLDRVTTLRPEWAEAWSLRAAAFYQLEDQASALADLHQALSREPRLYDAWAALGHMALASGDKPRALAAFRKALALHPYLDGIKETADKLAPEVDGREL